MGGGEGRWLNGCLGSEPRLAVSHTVDVPR